MSTQVKLNNNQGDVSIIKHLDTDTPQGDFILDARQLKLGSTPIPDRASLKALKGLKDGDVVYQSDIDLVYVYEASNTEDDNGGTIIEPDSGVGRLVARYNGAVNVKWFGADENKTDNEIPFQAALDNSDTVEYFGPYILSGSITINQSGTLKSVNGYVSSGTATNILTKASTMTTPLVLMKEGATLHNVYILGEAGNTSDGVHIIEGRCSISECTIKGMGDNGIRIGIQTDATNCNLFSVQKTISSYNGGNGILIFSNDAGTPNADAGSIMEVECSYNTLSGVKGIGLLLSNLANIVTQGNKNYGLELLTNSSGSVSRYNTIYGGDYEEGNINGNIYDPFGINTYVIPQYYELNNIGVNNSYYGRSFFSPSLTATTGKFNTPSAVISTPLTVENTGNIAVGRGAGIALKTPSGGNSIDAGRIEVETLSNIDSALNFYWQLSGTLQKLLTFRYQTIIPVGTIDLGSSTDMFNSLYTKDIVTNLPTSDPAIVGKLWNDAGTVKVSAG